MLVLMFPYKSRRIENRMNKLSGFHGIRCSIMEINVWEEEDDFKLMAWRDRVPFGFEGSGKTTITLE